MANKVQFLGFKRVSQSVFAAVPASLKAQYLWFVKPDGDNVNDSGDIYLGEFHYGHYGKADADNVQELWDTLGGLFSSDCGNTVSDYVEAIQASLGTGFTADNTVADVINALDEKVDEKVAEINETLGEGWVDESGNPISFTEKVNEVEALVGEVDNEWRRVVGDGFVDDAIVVDGERFFEGETVSNVVCANTMALMIEIDEPINVSQEDLDNMGDKPAAGLTNLLNNYSEVNLPEGDEEIDLENNIIVGE